MSLTSIELRLFRNIEHQALELRPGLNIFRGPNGQGKTNLIEAVFMLTHGKSFRTTDNSQLIKRNAEGFKVSGHFHWKNLSHNVEIFVHKGRKKMSINGKPISSTLLRARLPSVLFSPESLMIVKGPAQKRRELIDDVCTSVYPEYAPLFLDCGRILRQKSSLLKQLKEGAVSMGQGEILLRDLSHMLFEKSAILCEYRLRAIEEMGPLLLAEFLSIMDEHYGDLSIDYVISGNSALAYNREHLRNAMYKRWLQLKDRELSSGLCLVGPHKHDVHFYFNGHDARFFCSQGQQRAIILAFKMAHIRLHYAVHMHFPILLLDDVLSELDREKQERFMKYLVGSQSQIFLTTTDASPLPEVTASSVFEVENGRFTEGVMVSPGGLSV
ncbi:MAG: DNA replication and repair protein RecF [Bdellovibrionales bacterium]|nr:DNA replication and repair protein RecF [Bdellovibrionales bacterium]